MQKHVNIVTEQEEAIAHTVNKMFGIFAYVIDRNVDLANHRRARTEGVRRWFYFHPNIYLSYLDSLLTTREIIWYNIIVKLKERMNDHVKAYDSYSLRF